MLGKQIGVDKNSVSFWENGKDMTLAHLRLLSRALDVQMAWLLEEEGVGRIPGEHREALEISRKMNTARRTKWLDIGIELTD